MRTVSLFLVLFAILAAGGLQLSGACESPVEAQPRSADGTATDRATVVLARACVHEENWNTRGCAAIYQALRNRGHETVLEAIEIAPRISSVLDEDDNGDSRSWINRLELGCHEPAGFPEDLDWDGDYRARCERVMQTARNLVRGRHDRRLPCRGPVVMWGGDCATEAGACDVAPPGYAAVECGAVGNVYYKRVRDAS